ncbi:Dienelactone hydrolase family protein [Streptomyces sp. DvalAA-14]|nr:Dienelactone hydrolase family protein [Streptomyces sp. DvalAA-14]
MPPAQRDAFTAEMQTAGVDWRLTVYGGALHAFHHPPVDHPVVPGVGYHPRHAQRAWRDVVDLLAECLPVTEDDLGQSMPSTMRKSRSTPSERATRAS